MDRAQVHDARMGNMPYSPQVCTKVSMVTPGLHDSAGLFSCVKDSYELMMKNIIGSLDSQGNANHSKNLCAFFFFLPY